MILYINGNFYSFSYLFAKNSPCTGIDAKSAFLPILRIFSNIFYTTLHYRTRSLPLLLFKGGNTFIPFCLELRTLKKGCFLVYSSLLFDCFSFATTLPYIDKLFTGIRILLYFDSPSHKIMGIGEITL